MEPDESELLSTALGLIHASSRELGSSKKEDGGGVDMPSGPGDGCCCTEFHVNGDSTLEEEAGDVPGGVGGARKFEEVSLEPEDDDEA